MGPSIVFECSSFSRNVKTIYECRNRLDCQYKDIPGLNDVCIYERTVDNRALCECVDAQEAAIARSLARQHTYN